MDRDLKEVRIEYIRSYNFIGVTMRYMLECVVHIFEAVRFQLFNVRIVITSPIPEVWWGIE